MQDILNHTVKRLSEIKFVKNKLLSLKDADKKNGRLICKWGFDGSSGQSEYKQKYQHASNVNDAAIFSTTLVQLNLLFNGISVWKNPCPSSVCFCRPIRIQFKKEDTELLQEEKIYIETQISHLSNYSFDIYNENNNNQSFKVKLNIIQ